MKSMVVPYLLLVLVVYIVIAPTVEKIYTGKKEPVKVEEVGGVNPVVGKEEIDKAKEAARARLNSLVEINNSINELLLSASPYMKDAYRSEIDSNNEKINAITTILNN